MMIFSASSKKINVGIYLAKKVCLILFSSGARRLILVSIIVTTMVYQSRVLATKDTNYYLIIEAAEVGHVPNMLIQDLNIDS